MVVGEWQKYLAVLLTFKVEIDRLTNKPTEHPTSDVVYFLTTKLGLQHHEC